MNVEKIQPKIISIKLEKRTSKIFSIKPVFVGDLPEGVSFKDFKTTPSELEVFGPRFVMSGLKELNTKNIDLDLLLGHSSISTEIILPDERLELLVKSPIIFEYQLTVPKPNLILNKIPIKFLTTKSVIPEIQNVDVSLFVNPSKLKGRSKNSFNVQVWADIPANSTGKMLVNLKALTPPGVHIVEIKPKSVVVNIK